ncbi:MAG: undecaprenyl/decaprenyl-phosphate alpha-N-acetylglucosaminyl 1-phosphate transferase [Thermoleophilaceae bacterium]|nr:undecaprenyl/decaprenyl-phosphate alpha-N-acetylglucosaminyl 1-phosphate transferase [Thermoleophilaceae bacterium]
MTPVAAAIAWRIGAIDEPRERGLHQFPTPRLGGLAVFLGVLAAALVFLPDTAETRGILIGAAVITLVGALDDLFELSADVKLAGQALAALIPISMGVRVASFTLPFLGHVDLGTASYPLTMLGVVAVMNAVNFIDGVDGLAAGVCTIAAATFAAIALSLDRDAAGVLALVTAGACLGYLRHGFHPASIFLGDSGSNLLGYLLAVIAVQGALKTNAVIALVFPLVILAVPILDSSFVIAKRVKYGRPVYKADAWHFHHRLANIGFSQRRTAVYIYLWTLSLGILALALRFVPYTDDQGHWNLKWSLVMAAFGLLALAASVYLVVVLEILKLRRFRQFQLRRSAAARGGPPPDERDIDALIARELETGELDAVEPPERERR